MATGIAGPIEQLIIKRDGVGLAPFRQRNSAEPPDTAVTSSGPSLRAHKEAFVTKGPVHRFSRHDGLAIGDILAQIDRAGKQGGQGWATRLTENQ